MKYPSNILKQAENHRAWRRQYDDTNKAFAEAHGLSYDRKHWFTLGQLAQGHRRGRDRFFDTNRSPLLDHVTYLGAPQRPGALLCHPYLTRDQVTAEASALPEGLSAGILNNGRSWWNCGRTIPLVICRDIDRGRFDADWIERLRLQEVS